MDETEVRILRRAVELAREYLSDPDSGGNGRSFDELLDAEDADAETVVTAADILDSLRLDSDND